MRAAAILAFLFVWPSVALKVKEDGECVDMCKQLGKYPDHCNCPGFAGEPAQDGRCKSSDCHLNMAGPCRDMCNTIQFMQTSGDCVDMCKTLGKYPDHCNCPGFAGEPAQDGRCKSSDCHLNMAGPCRDMCNTIQFMQTSGDCVDMCKTLGKYPDHCNCPGFAGEPAQDGRCKSYDCHLNPAGSCRDMCETIQFMQTSGDCVDMCKTLGKYPDHCNCPGFAGEPAQDGRCKAYDCHLNPAGACREMCQEIQLMQK